MLTFAFGSFHFINNFVLEGPKGIDVTGVMHDFEWALVNSIERWFKCEYHLGCFFHWKQAIRHNLVEKGFQMDAVKVILPLFDFLTVIKKQDIRKGVEYISARVHNTKKLKRSEKKTMEEILDNYSIPTWLEKNN